MFPLFLTIFAFMNNRNYYYVYSHSDITELTIPEGIIEVRCWNKCLSKITLPQGVEYISCIDNKLTELHLPQEVKRVYCSLMNGIEEQYKGGMYMNIYQKTNF